MDWSCVPPVLEADDDNRDDVRFHKIHDVVLLLPRRRKQKIDMIQFQIRKEGEGNADEKEFFISR